MPHTPVLFRSSIAAAAMAAACLLAACAQPGGAQGEIFQATLSGAMEVPPVATGGSGEARLRFDPKAQLLYWRVTHGGLSGPVTAGHIHGPAGPGQVAPPVIPFTGRLDDAAIAGQVRITPEQLTQLQSGQWYVNLHTARHPQGEVRGQLRPGGH